MRIYYDGYHEGVWFRDLHPHLAGAELEPFPPPSRQSPGLASVLAYDRPDIVLTDDDDMPLLSLERTIEVPSGHNVGQRFARLAAAARAGVPAVYFGPYSAYKHGGVTRGPRYMNLRLFHAIDATMRVEGSPITTVRWPTDDDFEIIHGPEKDVRLQEYLELFFELLDRGGVRGAREGLLNSDFERQQELERLAFIDREVRQPEQYDGPPPSVVIRRPNAIPALKGVRLPNLEVVLYTVGMRYVRSDPYTGTAILYAYLYCGGMVNRSRTLTLWFPEITTALWEDAARSGRRKDVRLFREVADGILFADGFRARGEF
jgi:hypothetical protein